MHRAGPMHRAGCTSAQIGEAWSRLRRKYLCFFSKRGADGLGSFVHFDEERSSTTGDLSSTCFGLYNTLPIHECRTGQRRKEFRRARMPWRHLC
eukprot:2382052-Amphidinium_carterae.1